MGIARLVAVVLLLAPCVKASESGVQDEDKKRIEDLEKQVAELTRRVKLLEDREAAQKRGPGPASTEPAAGAIAANEKSAAVSLKALATAEADFRTNDRDGNGLHDFWVGDVSGLFRYTLNSKEIKLIDKSIADADASPLKMQNLAPLKREQPVSKSGYFFAAIAKYVDKEMSESYHTGGYRNNHKFGFAAFPADYGKTGRHTLVVSETGTVWKKDLGGKPPEAFPESPSKEEWEKGD
jgi:hypothetical protein